MAALPEHANGREEGEPVSRQSRCLRPCESSSGVSLRNPIDSVAKSEGLTMAEVIRRAVDLYLTGDLDPSGALEATFGSYPEACAPSRDE